MTKLIMDPSLFEAAENMPADDQLDHFMFLKDSIDFASDYFEASLDGYDGAPYSYNSESHQYVPPITKSLTVRNRYSEISKKVQKMVLRGDWIELQDKLIEECSMQFEDTTTAEVKFKQYLYHIFCTGIHENSLLLLSQKNKRCAPSVSFYIDGSVYILSAVCNPATDCSGIVPQHLKQSIEVDEIFPQCAACCKLNDTFKEKISKCCQMGDEKKAIYITFGTEVALRNNYHSKPDISRKNPSYVVFVHSLGKYYLSIDKEHGALEVFKNQGKHPLHLGEYDFSCSLNKGPEPETHKLVV